MNRRNRIIIASLIAGATIGLPAAHAGANSHGDDCDGDSGDRGNHEAIWLKPQHHHDNGDGLENGSEWGKYVSYQSSEMKYFQGSGASEGVHMMKCIDVPGHGE